MKKKIIEVIIIGVLIVLTVVISIALSTGFVTITNPVATAIPTLIPTAKPVTPTPTPNVTIEDGVIYIPDGWQETPTPAPTPEFEKIDSYYPSGVDVLPEEPMKEEDVNWDSIESTYSIDIGDFKVLFGDSDYVTANVKILENTFELTANETNAKIHVTGITEDEYTAKRRVLLGYGFIDYFTNPNYKPIGLDADYELNVGLNNWEDYFEDEDYTIVTGLQLLGDGVTKTIYGNVSAIYIYNGYSSIACAWLELSPGNTIQVTITDQKTDKHLSAILNDVFNNCIVIVE